MPTNPRTREPARRRFPPHHHCHAFRRTTRCPITPVYSSSPVCFHRKDWPVGRVCSRRSSSAGTPRLRQLGRAMADPDWRRAGQAGTPSAEMSCTAGRATERIMGLQQKKDRDLTQISCARRMHRTGAARFRLLTASIPYPLHAVLFRRSRQSPHCCLNPHARYTSVKAWMQRQGGSWAAGERGANSPHPAPETPSPILIAWACSPPPSPNPAASMNIAGRSKPIGNFLQEAGVVALAGCGARRGAGRVEAVPPMALA